jgi:hypothetical protein
VSCAHLEPGATIDAPPLNHAATLLVIHGRITLTKLVATTHIDIHAGVGCVFDRDERYSLHSDTGTTWPSDTPAPLITRCEPKKKREMP